MKDGQMKRAGFAEDQIMGVLKEYEAGAKTADLARKHGVSKRRFTTGRPSMVRPCVGKWRSALNLVVCINLSGLFVELERPWP